MPCSGRKGLPPTVGNSHHFTGYCQWFCLGLEWYPRNVNIRWRRLDDVAYSLKDILRDEKHREMFVKAPKSRRRGMAKEDHLRTFYQLLIWKHSKFEIDDYATARHLMETECRRWPLMQFQFACLYSVRDYIEDDFRFDKYRRSTFKKQLADHPVYDFWLTLLESNWEVFFDTETRLANQRLQLCFRFAVTNGFYELTQFIWSKIGNNTNEYIGLLQWRSVCFRCFDRDTMHFLCTKLCELNPVGMARISWTAVWSNFYHMLNKEESDVVVQEKFKKKIEFLLQNCCPELRKRLTRMENFRLLSDSFRYNREDTFSLILKHMDADELREAREVVDRIHDRTTTSHGTQMRRFLLRRQLTTND